MSTYVLIHGAWHGAWCWDKVASLLAKEGHTVVAPNLPGHGDDKTPISKITLRAYADCVCEVINIQSEPVILVGHSLGGIVITQAAEICPDNIQKLVFLTAFLLKNGETILQYAQEDTEALVLSHRVISEDKSYTKIKDEAIKQIFYADCSDEDVERARSLLSPQATAPSMTPVNTTKENFGRIPRIYIECLQDKAISPSIQRRMYTNLSCEKVVSMDTSHSPFFSAPEELVGHLLSL